MVLLCVSPVVPFSIITYALGSSSLPVRPVCRAALFVLKMLCWLLHCVIWGW